MSFIVEYNNGKLNKSELLYERKYPCPSARCSDGVTYCVGEVFNQSFDDISKLDWVNEPTLLNNVYGDIAVVCATDTNCVFAVDMCGIDNLFYYHKDRQFIISDNIWDIIAVLEPNFSDLNSQWIRSSIVYNGINGDTFINGLRVLMPNEIGIYDAVLNTLNIKQYKDFKYSCEIDTLEAATISMDETLDDMFSSLRTKFGNDCIYGMGLSGGLDSRVIPHYAKKHNLNLVSWNICTRKPNGIFEASSIRNAKKLARAFNIPFSIVEWKNDNLQEKLNLKVANMPMGTSGRNIFKYESKGIPNFDIMLSGGFGILIGDYLPSEVPNLNKEELKRAMEKMFVNNQSTAIKGRIKRGLNYVFGFHLNVQDEEIPESVSSLLKEELDYARERISDYVDARYDNYSNTEIFESYWLNLLCTRDRNGAFESMLATRRSIATYNPFIFKQIMKWDPKLLIGRQVLRELINTKIPYVANISTDSYTAAVSKDNVVINRIFSVITRLLRGNGTAIDENNFKKQTIRTISNCLNNECEWFYKIIDTRSINKDILCKKHLRIVTQIWEMKALVDFIETKSYLNLPH